LAQNLAAGGPHNGQIQENLKAGLNLVAAGTYLPTGGRLVPIRPGARSDQQEIEQRQHGRPDAGGNQEVIGAEIVERIEQGLAVLAAIGEV
jgi:hypothetical protein